MSEGAPGPGNQADRRLLGRTRGRLVLWSGGITLAILIVLGSIVWLTVAQSLRASGEDQLRQRADRVTDSLRRTGRRPGAIPPGGLPIGLAFGGRESGTFAVIVPPDGQAFVPPGLALVGLPIQGGVAVARGGSEDIRASTIGDVPVLVLSQPLELAGERYVLQVIGDRSEAERLLRVLSIVLVGGSILGLLLALGGGALYAGRALVPIRDSLRRQREFAADASHELRTPLTVIRGSVDHLLRHPDAPVSSVGTALTDVQAEVDHLTRLVDDLLLLARADSGSIELQRMPVDLADVAAGATGGLSTLAEERRVRLVLDGRPAEVNGDPGRLRQLVTILVDNAIRHSPADTQVDVGISTERHEAVLRVDDAGPGIRAEDRERIFERFWRAPDAPSDGIGLGLSIAAWLAERHEGSIRALTSPAGGARFEVRLPLADSP